MARDREANDLFAIRLRNTDCFHDGAGLPSTLFPKCYRPGEIRGVYSSRPIFELGLPGDSVGKRQRGDHPDLYTLL